GLATRGSGRLRLRNVPQTANISTAELGILPRLPDTSQEIRDIAGVLNADVQQDIYLQKRATVHTVLNTNLANRRVVMFATHGLVPGELDGLVQPALALTSPEVADPDSDGLLTMDKILTLKLNADWVVLSACNTAAGDGNGAEAVSGLGRAFFYAGTRALLVSNWPVETVAARKLMTDLFRRQVNANNISKAEALRQAMLGLIDGPGAVDEKTGRVSFSYAHPLFWAPFVVVGD
ncbi:MAG TPA: CHAT domain-containing protein, partial [Rhodocyclaceae bacterium]|nr:CHAT domain-containing protein [Rhodocyclaceae bacterium]